MKVPVILLSHNLLHLTKRAVESILAQDVEVELIVVDNGSDQETLDWLFNFKDAKTIFFNPSNTGITAGWNKGVHHVFDDLDGDQAFIFNNDVILPSWFCSAVMSYEGVFLSGVSVDRMEQIAEKPPRGERNHHPDFSGFLIRREYWEKMGPFDERMFNYCSDCAAHIEAHRKGVTLYGTGTPFYHERSSTIKLAPPEEQREMHHQADHDRKVFAQLYGCLPGTPQYEAIFKA